MQAHTIAAAGGRIGEVDRQRFGLASVDLPTPAGAGERIGVWEHGRRRGIVGIADLCPVQGFIEDARRGADVPLDDHGVDLDVATGVVGDVEREHVRAVAQ